MKVLAQNKLSTKLLIQKESKIYFQATKNNSLLTTDGLSFVVEIKTKKLILKNFKYKGFFQMEELDQQLLNAIDTGDIKRIKLFTTAGASLENVYIWDNSNKFTVLFKLIRNSNLPNLPDVRV